MYMHIMFLEKFRIDLILVRNGTDVADACLCRFFHHISKLSGKKQLTFSWHDVDLDLKSIAANLCPGKTTGNSDLIFLIGHQIIVAFFSKEF